MSAFTLFTSLADSIYDSKYEYHKDKFTGITHPTTITCPYHGDFTVRAGDHINNNSACPQCTGDEVFSMSIDDFTRILNFDSISH